MDPWTERQLTRKMPPMSIESWAATKELYISVKLTPFQGPHRRDSTKQGY
jgi:hypothetical protein